MFVKDPKEKSYNIAALQDDNKVTICKRKANAGGRTATEEVARLYKVHNYLLGAGAFGRVYLAESKRNKDAKYAVMLVS